MFSCLVIFRNRHIATLTYFLPENVKMALSDPSHTEELTHSALQHLHWDDIVPLELTSGVSVLFLRTRGTLTVFAICWHSDFFN